MQCRNGLKINQLNKMTRQEGKLNVENISGIILNLPLLFQEH